MACADLTFSEKRTHALPTLAKKLCCYPDSCINSPSVQFRSSNHIFVIITINTKGRLCSALEISLARQRPLNKKAWQLIKIDTIITSLFFLICFVCNVGLLRLTMLLFAEISVKAKAVMLCNKKMKS